MGTRQLTCNVSPSRALRPTTALLLLAQALSRLPAALEQFASGIPGSVGGALFMNAGADGQETGTTVASVEAVDAAGVLHVCAPSFF